MNNPNVELLSKYTQCIVMAEGYVTLILDDNHAVCYTEDAWDSLTREEFIADMEEALLG